MNNQITISQKTQSIVIINDHLNALFGELSDYIDTFGGADADACQELSGQLYDAMQPLLLLVKNEALKSVERNLKECVATL